MNDLLSALDENMTLKDLADKAYSVSEKYFAEDTKKRWESPESLEGMLWLLGADTSAKTEGILVTLDGKKYKVDFKEYPAYVKEAAQDYAYATDNLTELTFALDSINKYKAGDTKDLTSSFNVNTTSGNRTIDWDYETGIGTDKDSGATYKFGAFVGLIVDSSADLIKHADSVVKDHTAQ